jgi:hypothetical protein
MYSKFIFKGNRVKIEMGAGGISIPGGYEYAFKRDGNKVSIEMKVAGVSMGGIDLNYNADRDELSLLFDGEAGKDLNRHAPVWAKAGSFDPNAPEKSQETTVQESVLPKKGFVDKIMDWFRRVPQPNQEPASQPKQEKAEKKEQAPQSQPVPAPEEKHTLQPAHSSENNGQNNDTEEKRQPVPAPEEKRTPQPAHSSENNGQSNNTEETQQPVPEPEEKRTLQPALSSEDNGQNNGTSAAKPVPQTTYTVSQLNGWLNRIADGDDAARDEMSKLNSVRVYGADKISNVQQLITDVSNGSYYAVADVQTDADGKVISITVRK